MQVFWQQRLEQAFEESPEEVKVPEVGLELVDRGRTLDFESNDKNRDSTPFLASPEALQVRQSTSQVVVCSQAANSYDMITTVLVQPGHSVSGAVTANTF